MKNIPGQKTEYFPVRKRHIMSKPLVLFENQHNMQFDPHHLRTPHPAPRVVVCVGVVSTLPGA